MRLSQDEGRPTSARIAEQAGFTLVELLVTMLIAIIVLGGGTYGLAMAFSQSSEISARTSSTDQAEVGFQELTRDLRYATTCPAYTGVNAIGAGGHQVTGVLVSTGPELQMCDPVPGAHATEPPPLALVTWTCNTATTAETCTRTTTPILCPATSGTTAATGACSLGQPTLGTAAGSTNVYGVTALTLTGLVSGVNQTNLLTDAACQLATGYASYGLTTSSTCPISWVGVRAQLAPLDDPGTPSDGVNGGLAKKTTPIQIQTGAALRNYGL